MQGKTNEVSEEEGRGGGKLGCEEGDGASGVLGDGGNGLDKTRGEGDDEETVDDLEKEVASHEGELNAGVKRDTLETREDCKGNVSRRRFRCSRWRRAYA